MRCIEQQESFIQGAEAAVIDVTLSNLVAYRSRLNLDFSRREVREWAKIYRMTHNRACQKHRRRCRLGAHPSGNGSPSPQ